MPTTTPVQYPIPAATAKRALHLGRSTLPLAELFPIPELADAITAYADLVEREKSANADRRALEAQRRAADDADREALARWHEDDGKGKRPEAPNRLALEAKVATAEQDEDAIGFLADEADRRLRDLLTKHGADLVAKFTLRREAARTRFAKAVENLEAAKEAFDGERAATSWARNWALPGGLESRATGASRHLRRWAPASPDLGGLRWPEVRNALRSHAEVPPQRRSGPHHTEVDLHATDALKRDNSEVN